MADEEVVEVGIVPKWTTENTENTESRKIEWFSSVWSVYSVVVLLDCFETSRWTRRSYRSGDPRVFRKRGYPPWGGAARVLRERGYTPEAARL